MPSHFDLDAYLDRIGYSGPRTPTIETLQAIHALHPAAIPFENLNPLLGWPVPGTPIGPRSHMVLLVDLDGVRYIADVGFGGNVLTAPLRLEPHIAQSTPHEAHRLMPLENGYVLEACINDDWQPFYRFTLEPQFPSDYEVSNWFLCNHPSSFFRHTLLAARTTPEARYALRNSALAIHRREGTEKRSIGDGAQLRSCLEKDFGLRLPESAELDDALERVSQMPSDPGT